MQHKITVKIRAVRIAKFDLMSCGSWLLKVFSKYQKAIKPCKNKVVTGIYQNEASVDLIVECIFSSPSIYLKNRSQIIDKLMVLVNNTKLHKKVSSLEVLAFHEDAILADFSLISGDAKTLEKEANTIRKPDIKDITYYTTLFGKIISWSVATNQIKIQNKQYGTVIVNYGKNQHNYDAIIKSCEGGKELGFTGLLRIGDIIEFDARSISYEKRTLEYNPKIQSTGSNFSFNILSKCQK